MTTKKKDIPNDVNRNSRQKQPKGSKVNPELHPSIPGTRHTFEKSKKVKGYSSAETKLFGLRQRVAKAAERYFKNQGNPIKISLLSVKLMNDGAVGPDGKIRGTINVGRGVINISVPAKE